MFYFVVLPKYISKPCSSNTSHSPKIEHTETTKTSNKDINSCATNSAFQASASLQWPQENTSDSGLLVDLKRGNTLDNLDMDFFQDDYFKLMTKDNKRPRLDEVGENRTLKNTFLRAVRVSECMFDFLGLERSRPKSGTK